MRVNLDPHRLKGRHSQERFDEFVPYSNGCPGKLSQLLDPGYGDVHRNLAAFDEVVLPLSLGCEADGFHMLPRHNAINGASVSRKKTFPRTGKVRGISNGNRYVGYSPFEFSSSRLLVELGQELLAEDVELLHGLLRRAEGADYEFGSA